MSARASKVMGFVIQVFRIRWLVSLLAVVIAFAIGAVFIVLADASSSMPTTRCSAAPSWT